MSSHLFLLCLAFVDLLSSVTRGPFRLLESLSNEQFLYKTGFAVEYSHGNNILPITIDNVWNSEILPLHITCMAINVVRAIKLYACPWILTLLSTERFLMMKFGIWAKTGITVRRRVLTIIVLTTLVLLVAGLYGYNTIFEFINNVKSHDSLFDVDRVSDDVVSVLVVDPNYHLSPEKCHSIFRNDKSLCKY